MPRGSEELTNVRKEEIILALLQQEYEKWIADLRGVFEICVSIQRKGLSVIWRNR